MEYRLTQALLVVFWIAAMSWLAFTKILPMSGRSATPDQRFVDTESISHPEDVTWNMFWDGRAIGTANMTFNIAEDGVTTVESKVQFRSLPVSEMANELIGTWALFAGLSGLGSNETVVSFDLESQMLFDNDGSLSRFRSSVNYGGLGELFVLRGLQFDDQLDIAVTAGDLIPQSEDIPRELFRRKFPMSADKMVIDAFAPSPRLANLKIGQEWTFQTFRPLPPTSPLRTVLAVVERREMIAWGGDIETVYVVSFSEMGSGLTSIDKPFSYLWVRDDGVVVKQELALANLVVEFRRQEDQQARGSAG